MFIRKNHLACVGGCTWTNVSQASALTTMPLQLNKGKLPTTSSSGKGWAAQKKIEMLFKGLNSGGKQGAGLDGMVALGYHGSLYGGGYSIQI